jgi:glycerophosphoryl diester phosphodiesterase
MQAASAPLLSPALGFAHRGASARAPENTLEAFQLALELGASGLESDVWSTSDGVPVLDHDGRFELAGVVRPIHTLERSALPPHVPTLAELYEACGPGAPLSLDLKDAAVAPAVVRVAAEAGALEGLWLCHWNWKTAAALRELSPAIKLVDSTRAHHMRTAPGPRAERMQRLGIDALNLHHSDWSDEMVALLHRRGRLALAWDTQSEAAASAVLALGIDAIYSDHVDRMMAAIRSVQRRESTWDREGTASAGGVRSEP